LRYYFTLQAKLFIRALKNYNEGVYATLIVTFLAFIFFSITFLDKVPYGPYLYLLLEVVVISSLGGKMRNQFLSSIFLKKKYIILRATENFLTAFPFMIFLLYKKEYWLVVVNIALCLLLSFCNNIGATSNLVIPSPFSRKPYEFTTGFRRTYWLLIILYCSTVYSLVHHNFILGLGSLLGVFVICMTFYSHLDPIFYVWIHAQPAKIFLRRKITTAILYGLFLTLPIAFLLIIFYPGKIVLILLVLFIGLGYLILSVLYVYVCFPVKTTRSQNLQYAAGIFSPPLLLLIIPNFYFQAVRRLKDYLLC